VKVVVLVSLVLQGPVAFIGEEGGWGRRGSEVCGLAATPAPGSLLQPCRCFLPPQHIPAPSSHAHEGETKFVVATAYSGSRLSSSTLSLFPSAASRHGFSLFPLHTPTHT
jgi:hypothetical protein